MNSENFRRPWLVELFEEGIRHSHPRTTLPAQLPATSPKGRNIVLGAGKAAAEMAAVAHSCLTGPTEGLVVTRYGHGTLSPTGNIRVLEAGHPVPDEKSTAAARSMLELAAKAGKDDRVIFLMSGGGSALLCAPVDGLSVSEKQRVTRHLLGSGASIVEINLVRKHLSRIKGGRLAGAVQGGEMLTYIISDVVGDNPADVASGPSISSNGNLQDAIDVLRKYQLRSMDSIVRAMTKAPLIAPRSHAVSVIANGTTALEAISRAVLKQGWKPVLIDDSLEGDATLAGRNHAEIAKSFCSKSERVALISGGELTVTIRNKAGRGGPSLEYLASMVIHLAGMPGIEAIAADSDGIDGSEDNAGGYVCATSLSRAASKNFDVTQVLATNNTYDMFAALDDLVITGPTGTNVNDIRIILVDPTNTK